MAKSDPKAQYYDGTKLLSMLDLDKQRPEIYICTSNRTAGKTTYFNRLLMNRYFKRGEKFILLYRLIGELKDVDVKFFTDIQSLFFPDYYMDSIPIANGKIIALRVGKIKDLDIDRKERPEPQICGYALSLKNSSKIKLYSHMMTDATTILFDEFQPEDNQYLKDELNHFVSLHTSLARGQGKQSRYLPVIMVSNAVTLLNPYYSTWHIGERLQQDTKFLKGHGWVMECAYNDSAANAMKASAFNRAFQGNSYLAYATENTYLNDSKTFIGKPAGKSRYLLTLIYDGKSFGVREYLDEGVIYISNSIDKTAFFQVAIRADDMDKGYQLLPGSSFFIKKCREYFNHGMVRFQGQEAKNAFFQWISY